MRKQRTRRQRLILKMAYAPGDVVMLTGALRDLHECYPNQFQTDVRTSCAELWENNPYLTPLDENARGVELIDCRADLINNCNQTPFHYIHAYSDFLSTHLKLRIKPVAFHGDIHLSKLEKSWYSQVHELTGEDTPFWIIVSGGKYDVTVKWWSAQRYQQVVDHFAGKVQFVQVGELQDYHPPLNGVIDLRGKTDLRQLVRLVYHSQGVLCGVTCLMHLAAAVERKDTGGHDRPCVVIAGGREPPQWVSYPSHQFLHTVGMLKCAGGGCWKSRVKPLGDGDERDSPDHICDNVAGDLPRCMDMITPEEVIRRMEAYFEGGAAQFLTSEQARAAGRVGEERRMRSDNGVPSAIESRHDGLNSNRLYREPEPDRLEPAGLTLVTLNDETMAPVARVTSARLREYAARHHYQLMHYKALLDPSRHPSWNKVLAVRSALLSLQSEWVMWLDADAMVMNLDFPATQLIQGDADMLFASDRNGFNAGVFLVRYCDWSLRFLEAAYFLGELESDPDGYKTLWEQSTFKHLIRSYPGVAAHVSILPQEMMNSDLDTFKSGDFILHLSGMQNEDRLKALAQFFET